MPFLFVHLTRMIDGTVTVGPNAVLAFKRESYRKRNVSLSDLAQMAAKPSILNVLGRNLRPRLDEMKYSLHKRGYLEQLLGADREARAECSRQTLLKMAALSAVKTLDQYDVAFASGTSRTSNLPLTQWAGIFTDDQTLTATMLDRLLQHANIVQMRAKCHDTSGKSDHKGRRCT